MKIYTIQHKDFLNNYDKNGFIRPIYDEKESFFKKDKNDFWYNIDCNNALNWMISKYFTFIEGNNIAQNEDLIWVWPNLKNIDWRYIPKNYSVFEFEVPAYYYKNRILWSDYINWHLPLNNGPKELWGDIFNVSMKRNINDIQGVTTMLHKKWIKRKLRRII